MANTTQFTVNPDYRYFVLNLSTGKIVSGWEYRSDAVDSMNEFNDPSFTEKKYKVYMDHSMYRPFLTDITYDEGYRLSHINPFDSANWGNK